MKISRVILVDVIKPSGQLKRSTFLKNNF